MRNKAVCLCAARHTLVRFGRVDVLLNNADVGLVGTVAEMEMDDLAYLFQFNVLTPVAALQADLALQRYMPYKGEAAAAESTAALL